VNSKQFKKWRTARGATSVPAKGGHLKVLLKGKTSILPMGGSKDMNRFTMEGIKKQLGLKV
jgi:hypothetical protein